MQKFLKRLQIKGFASGFLMCAVLSTTLVLANTGGVWREVFYDVNVVVNGVPQNFPADMTPFITEGRTFLPVRGIAEVLDVPVDWYGPTRTVYIGTIPHGMPFFQNTTHFQSGGSAHGVGTVTMLGNTYPNSLRSNNRPGSANASFWRDYNLNSQFNELTGTIGRIDGANTAASTISFIGDGRTLATFTVDGNTHPTDISVDLRGVLILRIQISQPVNSVNAQHRGAWLAFTNVMIE
ncbi:MAG: stalk domain-containing protein [Defluviitaleaceae bacterium]|nr:stalk domain-containing protein [Defluviitaleaceae bacterium]